MKDRLSTSLILFAVINVAIKSYQHLGVEAFTIYNGIPPRFVIATEKSSSAAIKRYRRLGNIEDDPLPEAARRRSNKASAVRKARSGNEDATVPPRDDIVVIDTVAVALDDDAREAGIKFVLGLGLALVLVRGAVQVRPAFAEADGLWRRDNAATVILVASGSVKESNAYDTMAFANVQSNLEGNINLF